MPDRVRQASKARIETSRDLTRVAPDDANDLLVGVGESGRKTVAQNP